MIANLVKRVRMMHLSAGQCAVVQMPPDFDPTGCDSKLCIESEVTTWAAFKNQWFDCFDIDDDTDHARDCFSESVYEQHHCYLGIVHEHGACLVAIELKGAAAR
jgi:hypothetical protein